MVAIRLGITWAMAFARFSASAGSVLVTSTAKISVSFTAAAEIIPRTSP